MSNCFLCHDLSEPFFETETWGTLQVTSEFCEGCKILKKGLETICGQDLTDPAVNVNIRASRQQPPSPLNVKVFNNDLNFSHDIEFFHLAGKRSFPRSLLRLYLTFQQL